MQALTASRPGTIEQADRRTHVRLAGLLYLIIIICGIGSEVGLRAPILSADDPTTALAQGAGAIRLSLLADSVMMLADVALALVFFSLLRGVHEGLARAAMVFRLMQAAVIGASLIFLSAVPELAQAGETALALQMAAMHATGYDIGLIFFGVNAGIMAWLLHQSGGVPRVLTGAIALSGLVYLTGSALRLAAPELVAVFAPAYLVPLLAETGLCLWLLIRARV